MQDRFETDETWVDERLSLVMSRIEEIAAASDIQDPYRTYFKENAAWLMRAFRYGEHSCREENEWIYRYLPAEHYKDSYDNPAYAQSVFGKDMGRILCWLQTELRSVPRLSAYGLKDEIAPVLELFTEIYHYFEEDVPDPEDIIKTCYWYISDYADMYLERFICSCISPADEVTERIVSEAATGDTSYLYRYGTAISDDALWMAGQMSEMDADALKNMAETLVSDYVSKHREEQGGYVRMIADIGSERLMREVSRSLSVEGFIPIWCMEPVHSICCVKNRTGINRMPVSTRYDADHAQDLALFLDRALYERFMQAIKTSVSHLADLQRRFSGVIDLTEKQKPLVSLLHKPEAICYNSRQQKMMEEMTAALGAAIRNTET